MANHWDAKQAAYEQHRAALERALDDIQRDNREAVDTRRDVIACLAAISLNEIAYRLALMD